MRMKAAVRKYDSLGIMRIVQNFLGVGVAANWDTVSVEEAFAGIGVAIGPLLHSATSG